MSTCHPRYITTRKQKYILHTRKKCSKSCVNFVSQLVAIFKTGSTARMASPSTAGRAIAHRCGARGTRLDQLLNHEGGRHTHESHGAPNTPLLHELTLAVDDGAK